MTESGIPPAIRAGHNWMRTAKAGFWHGELRLPMFFFLWCIYVIFTFHRQFTLETCDKIGYNTTVYTQISRCVMNPIGQMRGNDLP